MRKFYELFVNQNWNTMCSNLTWSHYREVFSLGNFNEIKYYLEECENQNIQFLIDPIRAELSFFNDMDIVTIFSNLINNAMESCAHSSEKKIYLNIHTENQNFIVIKIENTSDIEPIVINGRLKTHKDNAKLHGIGMNSISRALSAYNGSLDWKYNKEQKIFSTTIIIQNLTA